MKQPTASSPRATPRPAQSPLAWLGLDRTALRLGLLLLAVLGSGVMVVYLTHEDRIQFNELQQLRSQANSLQVEWGQLLLEQSTFGLEGRIENMAADQLSMQLPALEQIVMVKP